MTQIDPAGIAALRFRNLRVTEAATFASCVCPVNRTGSSRFESALERFRSVEVAANESSGAAAGRAGAAVEVLGPGTDV